MNQIRRLELGFTERGGTFEVVQLWVNLPASEKMSPPRYQEIRDREVPRVSLTGGAGSARIIAGDLQGVRGAAKTATPINLWDLQLAAGGRVELSVPEGQTAMLVVQGGTVKLGDGQAASGVALARFDRAGSHIVIECTEDARALLLSGEPIHEPVVGQGPFVMNTQEEIQQAMEDYRNGRMGSLLT